MENNSSSAAAIKKPKISLTNKFLASLNASCVVIAAYFGMASVFAAIAGFTDGVWNFQIPFATELAHIFAPYLSETLFMALVALAAALIVMATIYKLTSLDAIKKAWHSFAIIMATVSVLHLLGLVSYLLTSLLNISDKNFEQAELWMNGFLPSLLMTATSGLIACAASKIAKGNSELLRNLAYFAFGIAALALLLVIVATLLADAGGFGSTSFDLSEPSILDWWR